MASCTLVYTLNCGEVEIHFDFSKGYPATLEEPGCDDDYEINAVIYKEVNIMACVSEDDFEAMYSYIENYKGEDE